MSFGKKIVLNLALSVKSLYEVCPDLRYERLCRIIFLDEQVSLVGSDSEGLAPRVDQGKVMTQLYSDQ